MDSRHTSSPAGSHPVRVMHVLFTLGAGGMEHGVVKIVNQLDRTRVVSAICSTTPAEPHMRDAVSADVPVVELQRRGGNDPAIVWSLYRAIRRYRPHVLHTHAWGTLLEGLVAGRLARVPVIVHGEHGTLQLRGRQVAAQRWAWGQVDQLLSVSSRLAERMAREVRFPVDRIHVIRNGVNLARFGRVTRAVASDRVVLGAVGRLVDVKDHALFIDAVAALRGRKRNVEAVIAGEGPLRAALEERIGRHGLGGVVRLLGHRPDVEGVFAGLDIFVQPSKSEGMSNTVLEAMASGLPVVATRVGGADEMIVDGETGLLVRAGDPEALVTALDRLVLDAGRRQTMGDAGRRRASGEFSVDRMIEGYQRLYCDAHAGGARVAHDQPQEESVLL